jgi:hypothetical protein
LPITVALPKNQMGGRYVPGGRIVNVSFQLSLAALKMAQESAAAVAQQLTQTPAPTSKEFTEDLVELLVAEDVHEANLRAISATNKILGNLIDILV